MVGTVYYTSETIISEQRDSKTVGTLREGLSEARGMKPGSVGRWGRRYKRDSIGPQGRRVSTGTGCNPPELCSLQV